jgi:low molecular weight phosphotyrosine protein phosphatase
VDLQSNIATFRVITMEEENNIKVLFVCLGNICRSPMAEAVFKHTIKQKGLESKFKVDSCGTGDWHVGQPPNPKSVEVCRKNNVDIDHIARKILKKDFYEFDYLLCMDNSNLDNIKHLKPKDSKSTAQLFGDHDPQGEKIIRDPYYGDIKDYEKNFKQVTRCSEGFLKSLNLL